MALASDPASPKAGFSVLGQVKTMSRDEIRQEAMQDPFLEVYRSEKRPLSPESITNSPSKELTFIAISKLTGANGEPQDLRGLSENINLLQQRVEEQSQQLQELQPMKEFFQRQNMELYWSKVGSPRGVAAFEILKEVHSMLTDFMQNHIRSVAERLEHDDDDDDEDDDEGECSSRNTAAERKARRASANSYRQTFSRGPFKNKKVRQGTYEDLLMHSTAKQEAGEDVKQMFIDALVAAEAGFYDEAASAGFELHDISFIRSKMAKFLTDERRKRNEACHPLALKKSRSLKQEIVDDIERACDTQDLGDLNEITPFIKFGCLLFRRHNL